MKRALKKSPVFWINEILKKKLFNFDKTYKTILFDLVFYEDRELAHLAIGLLQTFFTQQKTLVSRLQQCQIIENPTMES